MGYGPSAGKYVSFKFYVVVHHEYSHCTSHHIHAYNNISYILEARQKADNSAPGRMSYVGNMEFAYTCPKLNRWNMQHSIKKFKANVMKML